MSEVLDYSHQRDKEPEVPMKAYLPVPFDAHDSIMHAKPAGAAQHIAATDQTETWVPSRS